MSVDPHSDDQVKNVLRIQDVHAAASFVARRARACLCRSAAESDSTAQPQSETGEERARRILKTLDWDGLGKIGKD